ncbi:MAG: hypothetical protein JRH20_10170 [Deltaproteobacteria bacterium]|nr:hypothetical protein [Deltaproteobacteria bacterium]
MTPLSRWIPVFALLGLFACTPTLRGTARLRQLAPELPITRVTIFQNGVGYFEREGRIKGDVLTLHCRPSQINDLLKSLTVIDRGSGRAVSISLPLDKNHVRVLSELPRQVRDASGLLDVLRVFRGARVHVEGSRGSISGRVVGVEKGLLTGAGEDKPVMGWRLTLKRAGGELVVYPVPAIERLKMLDHALQVGLERSLDVSLEAGTWKPITLTVRLAGEHSHDLLVSYVVEMPNWKPAYRLVVPEGRAPLLQGWAVVDNVSGEMWRDVKLSLVAGTPMSFTYDLHRPRFTRRIDLTPRGAHSALAPPTEQPGYDSDEAQAPSKKERLQRRYSRRRSAKRMRAPKSAPKPAASMAPGGSAVADSSKLNRLLEKQIPARVAGKKVGSLFRYELKDALTVPSNSSTLVNIVNSRVEGEDVVLFRPELTSGVSSSHPYRAVRVTNNTQLTLEKGPVAIYARDTFAGEGFLERMEKGQTIFLTYAIDNDVTMTRNTQYTHEPVRLLKIQGGMIVSEVMHVYRSVYTLQSQHDKPIVAYVKSKVRSGAKLRTPPAHTIRTSKAAYLPVKLAPKAKQKLVVEWVRPVKRRLAIDTSLALSVLKLYLGSGVVPQGVKAVVDKIVAAKNRIDAISQELSRLDGLRRRLSADQSRIRENIKILRRVKGNARLKSKLARNLSQLEDQLSKLTAKYVQRDQERADLRSKMRVWIGTITLDNTRKK